MVESPKSNAILLIEDNEEDYIVTKYAFEKTNLAHRLLRFETGDEALRYLFKHRYTKDLLNPCLVLLDLNLPGTDGIEVLKKLKNSSLKRIPVIILTTSMDENDIQHCYEIGANSYIQKPVDFEKFLTTIQKLEQYWFQLSVIPQKEN